MKVSKLTGDKIEYSWGSFGELTQVVVKKSNNTIKSQIQYVYDALNRRISRTVNGQVTKYAYDGEDIIAEFDGDNKVKALYLHGPGVDEPIAMVRDLNNNNEFEENEVFFYSKDHLNSIHDLTDYQGKPVQRYNYTAYGETKLEHTSSQEREKFIASPYGYTSREWEQETGDYYYRARYYDPKSGRFLSEDPIGFDGEDENLYRYVGNNPIYYNDPSGEILFAPIVGGAILSGGIEFITQYINTNGNIDCIDWGGVGKAALVGGAFGGFARILGPFRVQGVPSQLQKLRKYIRLDPPHHGKGWHIDGVIGKNINPASLLLLLGKSDKKSNNSNQNNACGCP